MDRVGKEGDGCIFLKQMAKFSHLFDFESNWETSTVDNNAKLWKDRCLQLISDNNVELIHRHLLLIRDPVCVLGSWMGKSGDVHGHNPHADEIGITQLLDVYSKVLGASINNPSGQEDLVVIDSDDLVCNPPKVLQEICDALGIVYRDSMLKWKAGPHQCDGPWAKYWYHDVWESTGWDVEDVADSKDTGLQHPRTERYRTVPPALLPALRMSVPAFNFLQTLTSSHRKRAIATPPSGKLYEDPRNEHVLVFVGTPSTSTRRGTGRIIPRDMAAISPFDSSVQGGDATWGKQLLAIVELVCERESFMLNFLIHVLVMPSFTTVQKELEFTMAAFFTWITTWIDCSALQKHWLSKTFTRGLK